MSAESLEVQRAQTLRKRLWGATILIALAVIILPLLLDGSGSESQFRRVESLREEPPRVINVDGTREIVSVPDSENSDRESWWQRMKRRFTEKPPAERADTRLGEALAPVEGTEPIEEVITLQEQATTEGEVVLAEEVTIERSVDPGVADERPVEASTRFRAWVVQAGSFRDETNALAVRDRLRRAGYPSFVILSEDGSVFRVRVGPMIDRGQAGAVRNAVVDLLGRDALVMPYP